MRCAFYCLRLLTRRQVVVMISAVALWVALAFVLYFMRDASSPFASSAL